jgi:hypothetical protein
LGHRVDQHAVKLVAPRSAEGFLRKVWRDKITFRSLNLPNPRQVPIGPTAVIDDNITFARPS